MKKSVTILQRFGNIYSVEQANVHPLNKIEYLSQNSAELAQQGLKSITRPKWAIFVYWVFHGSQLLTQHRSKCKIAEHFIKCWVFFCWDCWAIPFFGKFNVDHEYLECTTKQNIYCWDCWENHLNLIFYWAT